MIFNLLSRVPVFGDVLRIFNAYAYRGDAEADKRFAGPWLWLTAFWLQVMVSTIATILCMPDLLNKWLPVGHCLHYEVKIEPGPLATSILPNLLGFGIGIYALIFGLHKLLLHELQDSFKPKMGEKQPPPGSALILNAEMAVPLLVLTLTIIVGLVQQVAPNLKFVQIATWFSLWLSLIFTIELICTLFGLGENSILKNLESDKPNK